MGAALINYDYKINSHDQTLLVKNNF